MQINKQDHAGNWSSTIQYGDNYLVSGKITNPYTETAIDITGTDVIVSIYSVLPGTALTSQTAALLNQTTYTGQFVTNFAPEFLDRGHYLVIVKHEYNSAQHTILKVRLTIA